MTVQCKTDNKVHFLYLRQSLHLSLAFGLRPPSILKPSRFISWRNKQGQIYRGQATPAVLKTRATWTGSSRSPSSNPKIHRYPGKSMANPDPAGKSIHPILPQDVSRPSNVKFVRKNLISADYLSPKKSVSLPSSWPKQKKRRHVFLKATLEIRQMSVFGSTGGKSAQHRGSQTGGKSAQRQNQPNLGLIGHGRSKSLTGGGGQTWVSYTRLLGYPGV